MEEATLVEIGDQDQPEDQPNPRAKLAEPLAPFDLQEKIFKLVRQAAGYKLLRKGTNQVLKALAKQRTELVILAADCEPLQLVLGIPPICEQRNAAFCFVSNQAVLGRACDIKRSMVAAAIVFKEESPLSSQILQMKDLIEQLLY